MLILVCCVHNFMLQNYITSVVSFVYKLQRYIPKLQILLLAVGGRIEGFYFSGFVNISRLVHCQEFYYF